MKPPHPKKQTRANYENKLQKWIALWQTAEHPGGYLKIIWDLHRFLEVARKYPPAKTFARMKRDEIAKIIRSKKFLCRLRKDYGDDLWRKIGEDAIQTLIQPSEIIDIFVRLNRFFDEPEATMAYYEEASANPEIVDELDRILWGFWFETKRWNKVLNYAERCGWFADPFPIGEQESFLEKAVEVFYALLKTQDIPRMLELLKRLGNHPNPNKKDYLRQLSVLHREEAPPVVQQQIDQLMAVLSPPTKSKSITITTKDGTTVSLSGWSCSLDVTSGKPPSSRATKRF